MLYFERRRHHRAVPPPHWNGDRIRSMNLCTDSPLSAEAWFPAHHGWTRGVPARLPGEFCEIAERLIPLSSIVSTWIDLPAPWRVGVLVDHAPRSQFDLLVNALREGLAIPDGLVCLAVSGAGFHGHHGRAWAAVPGNIHLSVHVSPGRTLHRSATALTALPAVSLLQVLDSIPGLNGRAGIRWVNDIVIDGSKLAGYLVHTQSSAGRITGAVIGIGLNVAAVPPVEPTLFVPSVTTLHRHVPDPRACTPSDVLLLLLRALASNIQKLVAGDVDELVERYRERSLVVGRRVKVYPDQAGGVPGDPAAGTVAAIGDRLELILAGSVRPLYSGRVVLEEEVARSASWSRT